MSPMCGMRVEVQSGKSIAVIRFGPKDEDAKPKVAKAKAVEKEVDAAPAAEAPAKKVPAKRKKAAESDDKLI